MKHDTNFQPERQVTATEYKLALLRELAADDAARDVSDRLPVRVLSLIDRAFVRANAGEFR
jgi:hypothetical protein